MKEFISILFLSKLILLTTLPVDLRENWLEITPKSPLKAITAGASLQVDISDIVNRESDFKVLQQLFPKGTIEAKLVSRSGEEVLLSDGNFAYSEKNVRIILSGITPIPTNKEFTKVLIRSNKEIRNVNLYWKNYKH
jgi:hypothetical protein